MTSEDLWDFGLSELAYAYNIKLLISGRYLCEFIKHDEDSIYCFTSLSKDDNSCTKSSYANMYVHDKIDGVFYFGRLYMVLSDDLVGESKHSFALYLKFSKDNESWQKSIAVPASSIELLMLP